MWAGGFGTLSGAAVVGFETFGGTVYERGDDTPVRGQLEFAPRQASASFDRRRFGGP